MQTTGLKRDTIDKYYTKRDVVEKCMAAVKQYLDIKPTDTIIEPSAGDGAFIDAINAISSHALFYDILPQHPAIQPQDFLQLPTPMEPTHVIGNPPFGRQSSLAIQFIKKCCQFAKSISFILPKSFKKDSMRRHFSPHYHLLYEMDMPSHSFLVNQQDCDVPCVFQLWEYREDVRETPSKKEPAGFVFTTKEDADISFRRVGVYAGTIKQVTDVSEQSHYFIKFTNGKTVAENMKRLSGITFTTDNTVGPKSISKQELIAEFNQRL
jgi:hypothetical protein